MADDFREFATFPKRWERPSTSLGNWSLGLVGGCVAMTILFFVMLSITRNDLFLGCTLASAGGLALTAAVVATVAIKRRGEQSILMVLPLLMGGIAAMFAFGVLVELVVHASA